MRGEPGSAIGEDRGSWGQAFRYGGYAGLVAGCAIGALVAVIGLFERAGDSLRLLQAPAYPFLRERTWAAGGALLAVPVAVVTHLLVSAVCGCLFARLFCHSHRRSLGFLGVGWGLLVWLTMFYVVLPAAGAATLVEAVPVGRAALLHVAFGLALALAYLPLCCPSSSTIAKDEGEGPAPGSGVVDPSSDRGIVTTRTGGWSG